MKPIFSMLLILSVLFIPACSEPEHGTAIRHDLGTAHVAAHPQRVAVLNPGFIDTLHDLGIKPAAAADDRSERNGGSPSVGTRSHPDLKKIASLKPDLIIADSSLHRGIYHKLTKIAPTIALKNEDADYQDAVDAALTIEKAVGKKDIIEKQLSAQEEKLNESKRKLDAEGGSILLIDAANGGISVKNDQFFTSRLLALTGFTYAIQTASGKKNDHIKMTPGQLLRIDPDYIVLLGGEKELGKHPLWKQLTAVKNGRVYRADRAVWTERRSIDGADAILHDLQKKMLAKKARH
ncbi:ABC transporter substrate-binding protein [Bacillus sp. L381]|uniref:ABC transporter substrate-binding protein n=1 Tax=Bacillus TaxID=1386 RepID=UPI000E27362C|nr:MULTISPECIES: ABC transporter substrate-binding protein [Bacillus]MCR9037598.1 ABC transporter substrate-binding protein [Bacillus velezensis]QUN10520.1 ABC transporter substrate-binding protein [Bacillus amyloliquefaciens]QYM83652.1 ABC transporter substrate-binding protein [Bacillus sp. 7D3]QZY12835.1 ABC transporter substrate-binding protein [Bacillus amyloliquefaciens]RDY86869.1 iron-dicitrate ABC transporter substrate-binding protein [Bacillus amyloliquefaciens]